MNIDLVYTYVNPNDEEWMIERNKYSKEKNNSECRYRDNDELKYSLRSVEKFIPWVNRIYIVSNSKSPEWLNLNHPKIRYVQHEEFMPKNILPCYNSNVIEAYIPYIKELSEYYIYACDDMMFGRRTKPKFFFKKGKPIVRMCHDRVDDGSYYYSLIENAQKMIKEKYGVRCDTIPWHNIDPYLKSENINCMQVFGKEYAIANQNRLRKENDIQRVLFHYFYMVNKKCEAICFDIEHHNKVRMYRLKSYIAPEVFFDYYFDNIHMFFQYEKPQKLLKKGPRVFCLNDSEDTTEEDLKKYGELLQRMFPAKSAFENE